MCVCTLPAHPRGPVHARPVQEPWSAASVLGAGEAIKFGVSLFNIGMWPGASEAPQGSLSERMCSLILDSGKMAVPAFIYLVCARASATVPSGAQRPLPMAALPLSLPFPPPGWALPTRIEWALPGGDVNGRCLAEL